MLYRRFGRTELQMPVFTCGAMRYQQSWNDRDAIAPQNQKNLEACVERALAAGMNHIETARGYGTSEGQLGRILPRLPRDKIIVQTKVGPEADPQRFVKTVAHSMSLLKVDYLDLLALHGINSEERLDWSVRKGGCLQAALQLKKEGRCRFVGFSSHAGPRITVPAVNDGRFDYANLHWYWVNPCNDPALQAAARHDMGVLIISPNDKGGKLYQPPEKLVKLCAPLSPMVFNDLWCLARKEVHTLSIGAMRPTDYDEHLKALAFMKSDAEARAAFGPVEERLRKEMERVLGKHWLENWHVGLPEWDATPGGVNIFEILRLGNFAKALDMVEFGKMRYNLLGNADHWFPGNRADKLDGLDLTPVLKNSPVAAQIPAALAEAHEILAGKEVKRLGKH
ncbi:MAG: aldo/keto reductase [Planctomycetota bacterium]|nr:aldo/keto reductase [Planctomycetota bacterium]